MRRDGKRKNLFVESSSDRMRRHDEKQSRDGKRRIACAENSNYKRTRLVESKKTVGRHCSAWRRQHVKKKSGAATKTSDAVRSCSGSRTRPENSWTSNAWPGLRMNAVANNKRFRHARLEKQKIGSVGSAWPK
jgi:hypothetical protein